MARVADHDLNQQKLRPRDYSELLKDIPDGDWVALFHDEHAVAGHGPSIESALEAARSAGEAQPVLLRVPRYGIVV